MDFEIINLIDRPELRDPAVKWFASKWGIPTVEYENSFNDMYNSHEPLPRWYAVFDKEGNVIAGCGLIQNDFVDRTDLYPYVCALFVEPQVRGNALGGKLLAHALKDAAANGFKKAYLCTNHKDYYEKYGWRHIATGHHPGGDTSRIYEADTVL